MFNPELATTLRAVRDGGANAFYDPQGTIAPQIIARATAGACSYNTKPAVIPSLMTVSDIASYQAVERVPVCENVLGRTVCTSAPPAFGGIAMLYMLNLMERGNIASMSYKSLEGVHWFIEASRLAQIDRRNYIGDPDFNYIPVAGLLDDTYLDQRFALFSPGPGHRSGGLGDTAWSRNPTLVSGDGRGRQCGYDQPGQYCRPIWQRAVHDDHDQFDLWRSYRGRWDDAQQRAEQFYPSRFDFSRRAGQRDATGEAVPDFSDAHPCLGHPRPGRIRGWGCRWQCDPGICGANPLGRICVWEKWPDRHQSVTRERAVDHECARGAKTALGAGVGHECG